MNTLTIAAGSLTLFYYDELNGPSTMSLAAGIAATDTTVTLNAVSSAQPDDFIQIEAEIFQVQSLQSGGLQLTITRGAHGSVAAAHAAGAIVYLLERTTVIPAFVGAFFSSPASANYSYSVFLPDVRIAAAEFYVSNMYGTSPVMHVPYSATTDGGLRTLSGGQIALQVDGYLAVQTDATPPFVMDEAHVPRDIFATLREAPSGGAVTLLVRQNSSAYSHADDCGRSHGFEYREWPGSAAIGGGRADPSGCRERTGRGQHAAGTRSDSDHPALENARTNSEAESASGLAMLLLSAVGGGGVERRVGDGIHSVGDMAPAIRLGGDRMESRQRL